MFHRKVNAVLIYILVYLGLLVVDLIYLLEILLNLFFQIGYTIYFMCFDFLLLIFRSNLMVVYNVSLKVPVLQLDHLYFLSAYE